MVCHPNRRVWAGEIVRYEFDCDPTFCTFDFFEEDVETIPGTYGLGLEHTFTNDGNDLGTSRDYSFRAIVEPGN